jgi:hypothetical protein
MKYGIAIGTCVLIAATVATATFAEVAIEQKACDGAQDAIYLSNETTELVVVPSLGRILRYGMKGGANVLWSCRLKGGDAWKVGSWKNWGGEKIWIWPQEMWPTRAGKAWPPPGDGAEQAWKAEIAGKIVRLRGPLFEGFNCRAIREIELAESGSTVTLTTRLEADNGPLIPGVAAWSVTQVRATQCVYARLAENSDDDGAVCGEWPTPKRYGDVLCFERDGALGAKTFVEADALATIQGELLFVQTLVTPAHAQPDYMPLERAQIFSEPDRNAFRPNGVSPYIELEFTAPRSKEAKATALCVKWSLQKLPYGERTNEIIARRMSRNFEGSEHFESAISQRD